MTDGQHLPDQNVTETALETNDNSTLKQFAALATIAALLISALWAIFAVKAEADDAEKISQSNAQKIEQKADREDVKGRLEHIEQKLDKLNDYLLNGKDRR